MQAAWGSPWPMRGLLPLSSPYGNEEPKLPAPSRLPGGRLLGVGAPLAALGLSLLYLPFGPAALSRPAEWAIVLGWAGLGAGLYALARRPS